MKQIIDKSFEGRLLRDYLRHDLGFSRKQVTLLKQRENGILLNGKRVTVRAVLHEGDILILDTEDKTSSEITPIKGELDIIYEDDDIIIVNKPYGMPTHPSRNHFEDTLANYLMHYFSHKENFVFRAINRLDRDTSGLVLVAKNKHASTLLSNQMKEREINKEYIAILKGEIERRGTITTYIRRRSGSLMLREVCGENEGGDICITEYERISSNGTYCAVIAKPLTGRTHQLRVHFSHLLHPIVGDTLYGEDNGEADRQLLHAYSLSFIHPKSGEAVTFSAPPPKDMTDFAYKNKLDLTY